MSECFKKIEEIIKEGDAEKAVALTKEALKLGIDSADILDKSVIPAMSTVGLGLKAGDFYIPDVLMSSRAAQATLYALEIHLNPDGSSKTKGVVVVGTVAGDLHDIGKNIASLILSCDGFEVIDLGIDVVSNEFVKAVRKYKPSVLGMSALLTTTINEMGRVIDALEDAGLRNSVKVLVSGAPVTEEFAEKIGADTYCEEVYDTLLFANDTVGEEPLIAKRG